MTTEECRRLMGRLAEGKSDAQVEQFKQQMTVLANGMADYLESHTTVTQEMIDLAAVDVPGFPAQSEEQVRHEARERIRRTAYAFDHSGEEDE